MNRDLLPNAHRLTESGRLVSIANQSLRSPSGTIRRYSPEGVPTVVVAHTDSDVISNILDVSSTVLFVVAFYQVFDVTCPFSVLALCMPIGLFFHFHTFTPWPTCSSCFGLATPAWAGRECCCCCSAITRPPRATSV